jgi:type II secretory pathway pseudopilin PulG
MKNLKTNPVSSKLKGGFGYIELFVVISIIGVLSAIAIPALSGVFGKAGESKAERNAQSLVATFNAARAAGHTASYASIADAISAITTSPGINGGGTYASSHFFVPMAPAEITEASARIAPTLLGSASEGTLTIAP